MVKPCAAHVAFEGSLPPARAAALADEKVRPHVAGKTVIKVIVVPAKLVNIVVK